VSPAKKYRYYGYLYLDTEANLSAEEAFFAYKEFASSIGFGFIKEGEFVPGSWIRRNIELLLRVFESQTASEIFDKSKKALELASTEKAQSNKANAASHFIKSIENIPNVVSIFGSLLVLKATIANVPQLMTCVLTSSELRALDGQPDLLRNPLELVKLLNKGFCCT